jgi:hypothetical protein
LFFVCDADGVCAFAARVDWFAFGFAGIRDLPSWFVRRRSVFWRLRWHPRIAFVLQASPLCGAAPTFLCRRKEK